MTAVKFCGFRDSADVKDAIRLGCDFVGLNFVPSSPRCVTVERAQSIAREHQKETAFVGVFMNADAREVTDTLAHVELDYVQFHGDESAAYCGSFAKPYIKALNVDATFDFYKASRKFPDAFAFLLDSAGKGGGSGRTFAWQKYPRNTTQKIFLAGGLNPDNVAAAIELAAPWGVDVASGIECGNRAKSVTRMSRFMAEVRRVSA